jgi:RNA-directed DNA polymerase
MLSYWPSWTSGGMPMETRILQQWLKVGCMTKDGWHPTDTGTPQGGPESPVLCNLTLDGLETLLKREHLSTRQRQAGLINLVRWADGTPVQA